MTRFRKVITLECLAPLARPALSRKQLGQIQGLG